MRATIWYASRGLCGLCGEPVDPVKMHLDHIVPRHCGGDDSPRNLRPTHPACNLGRRDYPSPDERSLAVSVPLTTFERQQLRALAKRSGQKPADQITAALAHWIRKGFAEEAARQEWRRKLYAGLDRRRVHQLPLPEPA